MNIKPQIRNELKKLPDSFGRLSALLAVTAVSLMLAALTGCAVDNGKEAEERQTVEYEILEESDIPEKLQETIEEKKEAEFKMSFENEDGLYLVHGYGEQETGGYSIAIRELSMTEQALYFDTELLGPEHGSNPQKKPSYPYIVVRTENQEKNVVFE